MVFFKIAWRNVLRNKFRSLITTFSIGIGFASLVFIRSFVDGADYQMVENYTNLISGHIQIHKKGFVDNMSLQKSISEPEKIESALKSIKDITAFAPRVKEFVLISSAEYSTGVLMLGIDFEKEKNVTELLKRVKTGEFVNDDKHIVIGKTLAKSLNVALGDKIIVMGQGYDGSLVSAAYRISGLLDAGSEDIDKSMALVTIAAAQDLFVFDKKVSEYAVKTVSHTEVNELNAEIKMAIDGDKYDSQTWEELSPILVQWIEFDIAFTNFLLLVVLLVVAAGILNTLLMGILERIREFGIMMALGTKQRQIVLMIGMESFLLGIIGVILGGIIGLGLAFHFSHFGIDLTSFSKALSDYYVGSKVYTRISFEPFLLYALVVLLTSIIVSVYPAWRAANLKPVEAIRHNV